MGRSETETEVWKSVAAHNVPVVFDSSRDLTVVGDDDNVQVRLRQFNEVVGFDHWASTSLHYHVLEFLVSVLAPQSTVTWTGWRVTSTVRAGKQFPVYRLEIFAQDGGSSGTRP